MMGASKAFFRILNAHDGLIVVSRFSLAIGGLTAIYLDPSQPSQGDAGYVFVGAYAVFALVLLIPSCFGRINPWPLGTHLIEIGLVCLLIAYTEGPSSPYFVYFTFLLLVATLRWQALGALATGGLLSLVLIFLTTTEFIVQFDQSDVDRLVLRNVYLLVASGVFAFLGNQLRRSNQRMERLRLAHELHDGTLQALTAAKLKLHTIAMNARGEDRDDLLTISHALSDEQRRIRMFVDDARALEQSPRAVSSLKAGELAIGVDGLRRLWSCEIDLSTSAACPDLSFFAFNHLMAIIREAVANAVVHGSAKRISISMTSRKKMLNLKITDDGTGLPIGAASYDLNELDGNDIGPRSIRRRVREFNGAMQLITSKDGLALHIDMPVG
jgi:signal transduction histidine kinase